MEYKSETFFHHNIEDIFEMLMNIERYPEFIKICKKVTIRKRGDDFIIADVIANYKFYNYQYTSEIKFKKRESGFYIIEVTGKKKSVKKFHQIWNLESAENGTIVKFHIEGYIKSVIFKKLFSSIISKTSEGIISSLKSRADILYSKIH